MAGNIRSKVDKPKRLRKRKARVEVSSSSSSDASSDLEAESQTERGTSASAKAVTKAVVEAKIVKGKGKDSKSGKSSKQRRITNAETPAKQQDRQDQDTTMAKQEDDESVSIATQPKIKDSEAEDAFTSFYLRQMTVEFAEDLDKIRSAGDFNDKSTAMLVQALKQGTACFGKDERLSIGRGIAARST